MCPIFVEIKYILMRSLLSVSFVRRPLLAGHGDNVTKRVRYVSILLWFPWPLCACVCVCVRSSFVCCCSPKGILLIRFISDLNLLCKWASRRRPLCVTRWVFFFYFQIGSLGLIGERLDSMPLTWMIQRFNRPAVVSPTFKINCG